MLTLMYSKLLLVTLGKSKQPRVQLNHPIYIIVCPLNVYEVHSMNHPIKPSQPYICNNQWQ